MHRDRSDSSRTVDQLWMVGRRVPRWDPSTAGVWPAASLVCCRNRTDLGFQVQGFLSASVPRWQCGAEPFSELRQQSKVWPLRITLEIWGFTMKPWKVADDAVGRHRCHSTPSMSHSRNKVYPKIRYKCPLWLSNIHKVILFRGTAIPDNLCFNKLCTNNFFKTQRIPFVSWFYYTSQQSGTMFLKNCYVKFKAPQSMEASLPL